MSTSFKFFLLLLVSTVSSIPVQAAESAKTQPLQIFWIDVEGGAATLIVTPSRESFLIDTGEAGTRDAQRIYKVAAETAGLARIDHLITTHFHSDHFGGAAPLAQRLAMGTVYDNGIPTVDPDKNPNPEPFLAKIKPYR